MLRGSPASLDPLGAGVLMCHPLARAQWNGCVPLGPLGESSGYLNHLRGETIVYSGVVAMALIAMFVVVFLYTFHRLTSVAGPPLTALPAPSGWLPQEHALSRFHARWYLASIVFLAFDVEMLFMYPWAVVVVEKGISAVVEMFLFLGALLVAVVWAWREGAFRWA